MVVSMHILIETGQTSSYSSENLALCVDNIRHHSAALRHYESKLCLGVPYYRGRYKDLSYRAPTKTVLHTQGEHPGSSAVIILQSGRLLQPLVRFLQKQVLHSSWHYVDAWRLELIDHCLDANYFPSQPRVRSRCRLVRLIALNTHKGREATTGPFHHNVGDARLGSRAYIRPLYFGTSLIQSKYLRSYFAKGVVEPGLARDDSQAERLQRRLLAALFQGSSVRFSIKGGISYDSLLLAHADTEVSHDGPP
ncbi:hypothetical protein HDV57DRAFT_309840 [Trichoderma longibrachiatum]